MAVGHSYEHHLEHSWDILDSEERKRYFLLGLLAGLTSNHDMANLEKWMPRSVAVLGPQVVEEALLQTILFAGFPRSIEALKVLRRFNPHHASGESVEDHRLAGETASKIIYGQQHDRLLEYMDLLHPELTRMMIEVGYGRVLSRPGMLLVEREFAVLGSLMATGMLEQFRAHVRGACNAGAKKVDIIWFTNTYECILAAELRAEFAEVTKRILKR